MKNNYCEGNNSLIDDSNLNNSIYTCLVTNNIITIDQFKDTLIEDISRMAEGRSVTETAYSLLSLLAQDIVSIKLMDEERENEFNLAEESINTVTKKLQTTKRKRDYLADYYKNYLSVVCVKKNLVFNGSVDDHSKYGKYVYSSKRLRNLGVVDSQHSYVFSCDEPIIIKLDSNLLTDHISLEELLRMKVGGIKKIKLNNELFDIEGLIGIINELYID